MQKQRGKAWSCVQCQCRQRGGGGDPNWKNAFCAHVLHFELSVVRFCLVNVQNSSDWDRSYKIRPQACSSDVIHVIKWTDLPPPYFHTASDQNWTVGRPWNETIHFQHSVSLCTCKPPAIIHTYRIHSSLMPTSCQEMVWWTNLNFLYSKCLYSGVSKFS